MIETSKSNAIDRYLCDKLQRLGRMPYSELAEQVGLSVPAVRDRIRKLEDRGSILGYHARLDPRHFDLDITVFVFVTVDGSRNFERFIERCKSRPEIQECHAITGGASHLLKVRARNTAALEKLLSDVQNWPGVKTTMTNLVLSTHVESSIIDTGAAAIPDATPAEA